MSPPQTRPASANSGSANSNNSIGGESEPYIEEQESRPTHTSEIGTLKTLPNHNTAWLGSSSGVYFVNTVRQAFSAAFSVSSHDAVPPSEDILTGDDDHGQNYNGPVRVVPNISVYRQITLALGKPPPDRNMANELITTFFFLWHPLFPFLHGPQFLKDVDEIYSSGRADGSASTSSVKSSDDPKDVATMQRVLSEHRKFVTFQLIINIASLDRPDIDLPVESRIKSTWDVTQIAGCIAVRHDINTIQACLAAELYLVATICLRQASTVAGIILKLIYHAGLHRCPLRYAQLSLEDCEIRKRIFWSAYALDRYLSLSLGDPNTVQDSDIDVCLSGKELHKGVAKELVLHPGDELKMHLPSSSQPASPEDPRVFNINNGPRARERQIREAAMTAYVNYGRLTGRVIEIFHKSIHARFPKHDAILYLTADMSDWWNSLPDALTGLSEGKETDGVDRLHHRQLAPFFNLCHQQLLLVLNRPRLSLDQSTAEFQHGLQMCIKASRYSITALKKHKANKQSMLLPGMLSATWMAGLIIAFACQLGKYPKTRACSDILACLELLESIGSKNWFTVKNCHKVLSLLLRDIRARKAAGNGYLVNPSGTAHTTVKGESGNFSPASAAQHTPYSHHDLERKRSHSGEEMTPGPSPKRELHRNSSDHSSVTSDFRIPTHPASMSQPSISIESFKNIDHPASAQPEKNTGMKRSQHSYKDMLSPTMSTSLDPSTFDSAFPFTTNTNFTTTSNDPTEAAQSASLPEDPMFWGNIDVNMSDIFSAVSWENMTGYGGPMPMSTDASLLNMNMNLGYGDGISANADLTGFVGTSDSGLGGGEVGGFGIGTGVGGGVRGSTFWNNFGIGQSLDGNTTAETSSAQGSTGTTQTRKPA